jgi:subtilisin family serine protease
MDGPISRFLLLFSLLTLAACADKTSSSVFPENSVQSYCEAGRIPTQFIVTWVDGHQSVEHAESADVFTEKFVEKNLALIEHIEFDKKISLQSERYTPPEAQTQNQTLAAIGDSWGQDLIETQAAWARGPKGAGALVAVVDTPVDIKHSQLSRRIEVNQKELNGLPGVDDDGNGFVDDTYGWNFALNKPAAPPVASGSTHGTHVAGIIAAEPTATQMIGVAPEAKIIVSSFLSDDGNGEGNLSDAISAMNYAASRGARVINASWGGSACSKSLRDTMAKLSQAGVLMAVASGNSFKDLDRDPDYPAAFENENQITVAALGQDTLMTRFSNSSYRFVNIAAPGENILSTFPRNTYERLSGTSMATPFVVGAAALLLGHRPNALAQQIKAALLKSVVLGNYRVSTRGRLNLRQALDEIERLVP